MPRPAAHYSKVLSFGEVLWDVFGDREVIGGAPFNVAAHLARLGMDSYIYSRVGSDRRGLEARRQARRFGVSDRWLQQDKRCPTGWVDVTLDRSGQPTFQIGAEAAWDRIAEPTAPEVETLREMKFSAIVGGTLALRAPASRQALAAIRTALPEVPVFYDVNLRGRETPMERVSEALPGVTLLKVNAEEATLISQGLWGRTLESDALFAELRARFGIKVMLCSAGAEGCHVFAEDCSFTSRAHPVKVASAVGAGDAASAAFLASVANGLALEQAAANANILGGFVASHLETIPDYSETLRAQLSGLNPEKKRV